MFHHGEMLQPCATFLSSHIWDHASAEIECKAILVNHYFRRIRIFYSLHRIKAFTKSPYLCLWKIKESAECRYLRRMYERLISLNVNNHVSIRSNFPYC